LNAGKLNQLLVFQVKTSTQDTFGGEVETWANSFSVWGEEQPLGTREFPVAHKRHAECTSRFIIRYRSGIDPDLHRIVHRGKYWNIQPPIPVDGRNDALLIEASEIT
jgi:SPP1 family predicted phage head-tail adaptor